MSLNEHVNLYEILEISSNASPQDVREAYIRTKSTYNRSNVALYSIISADEREEIIQKIEEAYAILSNPEKRREYDSNSGSIGDSDNPFSKSNKTTTPDPSSTQTLAFTELVESDDILIPPSTDFSQPIKEEEVAATVKPAAPSPAVAATKVEASISEIPLNSYRPVSEAKSFLPKLESTIAQEIDTETEWNGTFLKKVRDAYNVSLEEMIGITKLSKNYILAIEAEDFAKLPAPVYIRGFVTQIAKVLKLPHEKVASAYLARYHLKRRPE